MAKADGSIIIDTLIDTKGFTKGASDMGTGFGKIKSAAKKLGGILATAFATDKIFDFAKESIELGSNLQEVQNVVDVVFTTMNEDINEFAKNAAMTAGLSETMAKKYAGTFGAMADSFGFTEEEAYKMSTALTQLTGDVVSFYNLSQEEAYTKLKSVFTGETEALKDLGVVMTQTALDAYAMEKGFGKTTSAMTEQEKVALRYQFVMEQLNNASGDFVRTSDSWANQTRILSLQFDTLKATIGQGLITALSPTIQFINEDVMPSLKTAAEGFAALASDFSIADLFDGIAPEKLAKSVGRLGESFGGLAETIGEGMGWAWENVLVPFGEWSIEEGLPALIDSLASGFEFLDSVLEASGPVFKDVWNNFLAPLAEWSGDAITATLETVSEGFTNLTENMDLSAESTAEHIVDNFEMAAQYTDSGFIIPTQDNFQSLCDFISGLFADASDDIIASYEETVSRGDSAFFTPTQEDFEALGDLISGVWDDLADSAFDAWNDIKNTVSDAIKKIQGWIDGLTGKTVAATVNVTGSTGGPPGPGGSSGAPVSTYSNSIPYLATGAVIPPNAPFMAVLGDQTHGKNLEAPEELIRQIIRDEIGGTSRMEQLLEALISTVQNIEVGDTTIGEAAGRYNQKMNVVKGGAF